MGTTISDNYFLKAREMMSNFSRRTGLNNEEAGSKRRYLWTDAFAVQNFLALHVITHDETYAKKAQLLIEQVHQTLGRYAEKDNRTGWISNFPAGQAEQHPTVNGLRIGKKMTERAIDEPFDQRLEWERDGQYYHYHTRWINALLKAGNHFNESKYKQWAEELSLAGTNFIEQNNNGIKMYWKMSVDLSRPLVPMQGAHDPLEGFLTALYTKIQSCSKKEAFNAYIKKLENLCEPSDWTTNDALGLGGLLLNVIRAAELSQITDIPQIIQPQNILQIAEQGLNDYLALFDACESAKYRLAFRECGLSLGIRALKGNTEMLEKSGVNISIGPKIFQLADHIENFWIKNQNQESKTFRDHMDINEVSLASSLLARSNSEILSRI